VDDLNSKNLQNVMSLCVRIQEVIKIDDKPEDLIFSFMLLYSHYITSCAVLTKNPEDFLDKNLEQFLGMCEFILEKSMNEGIKS
jgi:hypothetical protein